MVIAMSENDKYCQACGNGVVEESERVQDLHCCALCNMVICSLCGWGKNLKYCHKCIFKGKEKEMNLEIKYYARDKVASFRKAKDQFGGFSNMAGGYPMIINGHTIHSSEAIYQACKFPHMPDLQKKILEEKSGFTAKLVQKPYKDNTRKDWDRIKVDVMDWAIRIKLMQNYDKMIKLFQDSESKEIVEDSSKDAYWGAIPTENDKTLIGVNMLGQVLMKIREDVLKSKFNVIKPLKFDNFLLYNNLIDEVTC